MSTSIFLKPVFSWQIIQSYPNLPANIDSKPTTTTTSFINRHRCVTILN